MNLVSVILPYYKKKFFIKECLYSIVNQTYKELEIIIVYDDENYDDLAYIKSLEFIDERFKIIINKKNQGAGTSRNVGIQHSKGNYIAFIDADDTWVKEKVEYQINKMIKYEASFTHTSYNIIDENGNLIGSRSAKNILNYNTLLRSCDIGLSTVMIKKDTILPHWKFPDLKTKEDFVFWLLIMKSGNQFVAINLNFTNWRNVNNSLSSSRLQKIKDAYTVYSKYENFSVAKSIFYVIILSINFLKKQLHSRLKKFI
jgi:teichuronic acid biosynthesis glycosyltransferase TuaG